MLAEQWSCLPKIWKTTAYKQWLLFIKNKFPLSIFLWDDSYGEGFLLCKVLNLGSNNPAADVERLESIIAKGLNGIDEDTLSEIFSMEFLSIPPDVTYLSPLKFFPNIKVIDFHCQNESKITDFEILRKKNTIYVLDYADDLIIDFDKYSNIRDIENIKYIKSYGFPFDIDSVYPQLSSKYKIYE